MPLDDLRAKQEVARQVAARGAEIFSQVRELVVRFSASVRTYGDVIYRKTGVVTVLEAREKLEDYAYGEWHPRPLPYVNAKAKPDLSDRSVDIYSFPDVSWTDEGHQTVITFCAVPKCRVRPCYKTGLDDLALPIALVAHNYREDADDRQISLMRAWCRLGKYRIWYGLWRSTVDDERVTQAVIELLDQRSVRSDFRPMASGSLLDKLIAVMGGGR